MNSIEIIRENYTIELEKPEIYVNNEARFRSGHMSHAMAQFSPRCFIDFNSNCSAVKDDGHSAYGWIEYRISRDNGKTYSDVYELPLSKQMFLDGKHTISVEKAVGCDDGTIVAFCMVNTLTAPYSCEPWGKPLIIVSNDEGETWSEAYEFTPYAGRIYDALYYKGTIYVVLFCNEYFIGKTAENVHRIYKSTDNGKTFEELCIPPIDGIGRSYASMLFDSEDTLHIYTYNINAECEMDHAISKDFGKTWILCKPCHLEKGIRNPQTALIDGVYILHGRAKQQEGFVFYSSENGYDWDEGYFLVYRPNSACFYSNNLNLSDENGNFLLVQYSDAYNPPDDPTVEVWFLKYARVNVMHLKLRIKK